MPGNGRLHPLARLAAIAALVAACAGAPPAPGGVVFRVATFNIRELGTAKLLQTDSSGAGADPQARAAAAIIQRIRPDVLLLNEIDHDYGHPNDLAENARRFVRLYLTQGPDSIGYPHVFAAPNNTGILTGLDLDGNGLTAGDALRGQRAHGDDAFGFGTYPGQFSMALLSRFPIDTALARTFQRFLWRDLPDHLLPSGFYPEAVVRIFRLSSKSHWDLPVVVGADTVHLLASHPTPPVFDGPEDRNGRRNFDEVGFWARYLDGSEALYDDRGGRGGLPAGRPFVILGDLNARADTAEVRYRGRTAMAQLLTHARIQDYAPVAAFATADFAGGARVDYVLPSTDFTIVAGGVFGSAPAADSAEAALARRASDHNLVWLDLRVNRR